MSSGWIKLHRQLLEWEWYDDTNTKCLFLHCLLRANHSDTEWRGHKIKRGQFLTSVDTLTRETGLTVSQIRTSLKKLISTNEIASKSQARSTVITVVQYDSHQGSDKPDDKLMTMKSQADDNEIATDKNLRTKEVKNVITKVTNDRFDDFWNMYDKKTGLPKCKAKFSKLADSDIELIFKNLPAYVASTPDKKFRKNPEVWINNQCWHDEIIKESLGAKSTHSFEQQNYTSGKF
tara:strand:- start:14066 stop:14767 length:702 start_codon:yes stop_codon:yes gene_type:complete